MNICPCCKTSHDSTACQTPEPQGAGRDALLALRIRSLISDKEMVVAMANRDAQFRDGWLCDYAKWHGEIEEKIQRLLSEANDKGLAVADPSPNASNEDGK